MDIKKLIGRTSAEKIAVRVFCSLFLTCFITVLKSGEVPFNTDVFFENLKSGLFIGLVVAFFVVLNVAFTLFDSLKTEKVILLISYFAYAFACTVRNDNIWFCLGACLVLIAVCAYVFSDALTSIGNFDIPKWVLILVCSLAGAYFIGFIGTQTVCRYLTQSTPCFDFGIFSQMFHYMRETLQPLVTCERDMLLSHFAVHISPIYYLFLPIYAVFPSPATLEICQAVTLASGIIPIMLIGKKLGMSRKATAVFAVIYAFYPALSGGCYYDLHENKLLAPLLLWLFYFFEKNKWWGIITFSVLVCFVKEDAAVYVAFAALYLILSRRSVLKGAAMFALSIGYFALVIYLLDKYGQGVMAYRYDNFMFGDDKGLLSVVKNVIMNPAYVISEMFDINTSGTDPSKMTFFLQMLIPLGFMPFITKKYSRFILLCPLVLINMMPDYVYQHNIFFQYTYGSLAFLFYAAMLNFNDMKPNVKRTLGIFALCAVMLVYSQTIMRKTSYLNNYVASYEKHNEVREALQSIPEDASVSASTFFVATCSRRDLLYDLDDDKNGNHAEYVAVDLRYSAGKKANLDYVDNDDYTRIYFLEGWCAIYRCDICVMNGHESTE